MPRVGRSDHREEPRRFPRGVKLPELDLVRAAARRQLHLDLARGRRLHAEMILERIVHQTLVVEKEEFHRR